MRQLYKLEDAGSIPALITLTVDVCREGHMEFRARCEELATAYVDRDARFMGLFQDLFAYADHVTPEERAHVYEELTRWVNHERAGLAARFAIQAGALIEAGCDPGPLATAIVTPLVRVLRDAERFLLATQASPEDQSDQGVWVGRRAISRASVDEVGGKDPAAAEAYFSLEIWYRPVVASWTRARGAMIAAQQNEALRAAVEKLRYVSDASWIAILLDTAMDEPCVFLFPQLGVAYSAVLDGVTDLGQLNVLMATPLRDPLTRVGAAMAPSEKALAVMQGRGPQSCGESFSSSLQAHTWRSLNPETGLAEDERFEWSAPGGTGTHSLPNDFQPATIAPLDGARVLLLTGPKPEPCPNMVSFTRSSSVSRMFSALPAEVRDVRKLSADDAATWFARVKTAVA